MKYSGKNIIRMNILLPGIAWAINASSMPRPKANSRPSRIVSTHLIGDLTDMSKPYQAKPNTRMAYTMAVMLNSTRARAMKVSRGLICL
ncbi:hypothetical protein D3C75_1107480 [compost metagenome]